MAMGNNGKIPPNLNKAKTMAAVAIVITVFLIILFVYMSLNAPATPVTVNELYDDQIDRNDDGVIDEDDLPLEWHSYELGDKVLVRDRIDDVWWDSDTNQTSITLVDYTGKYESGGGRPQAHVPGNVVDDYSVGDFITLESEMIIDRTGTVIFPWEWTPVE